MKQPNWKTPLILSAALFGIGGFAYWLQYSHKPKEEKIETGQKKHFNFNDVGGDDAEILLVKLKTPSGLYEIKCDSLGQNKCSPRLSGEAQWLITHPLDSQKNPFRGDAANINSFIGNQVTTVAAETIDLSQETPEKRKQLLDQYGLSDEKRTSINTSFVEIILNNGSNGPGKRFTGWIGEEHPLGDKYFVASSIDGVLQDKTVYLVPKFYVTSIIEKNLTFFRDKKMLDLKRDEVTEFKSIKLGAQFTAKKDGPNWLINGALLNTSDKVETLLAAITSAKATEFVDASAVKNLKPLVSYELKTKDKTATLSLYEKVSKPIHMPKDSHGHEDHVPSEMHHYLKTSDRPYLVEVEPTLKSNLVKDAIDLRDTTVLPRVIKAMASQLKVEGPDFKSPWIAKATNKKWDHEIAESILTLLTNVKIVGFEKARTEKPNLVISLGDSSNPETFHWAFFKIGKKLYAHDLSLQKPEAYLMEDALKNSLPLKEAEWNHSAK